MAPTAGYDEIADWYEHEFLGGRSTGARTRDGNPLDLDSVLRDLLGEGNGTCLEIGCGTGIHAAQVRKLGWTPIGVDLSGILDRPRGSRQSRRHPPPAGRTVARIPRRGTGARTVRGKRRTNPGGVGRHGAQAASTAGLTASPVIPHNQRASRPQVPLPGGPQPEGLPRPERRHEKLRLEQALQAFTIYSEGRIPLHDRHDHLHRRSDAPRSREKAATRWVPI